MFFSSHLVAWICFNVFRILLGKFLICIRVNHHQTTIWDKMFGTFTKHVHSKSKVVEDETILTRIHPISLENFDLSAKTMKQNTTIFSLGQIGIG